MIERLSLIVNEALVRVAARDLKGIMKREEGQGVTEYGVAIGFVAVVVAGLLVGLKTNLTSFFGVVGQDLGDLPSAL